MQSHLPPILKTADGSPRRVGLELEYSGVDLDVVCQRIVSLYGGTEERVSPVLSRALETEFGDFRVEVDVKRLKMIAERDGVPVWARETADQALDWLIENMPSIPSEVVFPPVPFEKLPELESLREALRELGAKGTGYSVFYAFGLHINVDLPDPKIGTLLRYLRAFLLLFESLYAHSKTNITRRLSPFISDFPEPYVRRVLDPDYAPNEAQFISDYLEYNPTRNRPLDLLPALGAHDRDVVAAKVDMSLVQPRRILHYRLPNSYVDNPEWTLCGEWAEWVRVEQLAADPDEIEQMCGDVERRNQLGGW